MMRKLIFLLLMVPVSAFGQTLEACQQAAEHNYPLIRQYGLIEKTAAVTESNLGKDGCHSCRPRPKPPTRVP